MRARRLTYRSSVCALIPHFECEEWLCQAIESLLDQTRPLDAIVVIDDGSPVPPVELVASYPGVTLLGAADNGGPYRLIQAAIESTGFDAYLFQDADDWSAPDRLEVLLDGAEAAGAELIGSHEVRVLVEEGDIVPVRYPLDVNAELAERPAAFPLLHPTSLAGRDLVMRLGGFATGMRFSGDAEFLRRAGHAARVVNVDHFGYFRRKRSGSLTMDPATALRSEARRQVQEALWARAHRNAQLSRRGAPVDLAPWRVADPARLERLAGPPPQTGNIRRSQIPEGDRRPAEPAGGPVFVIGAPRSGQSVLAWALGQHSRFHSIEDARWLARAAADVEKRASQEAIRAPSGYRAVMADGLKALAEAARPGRRWIAAGAELSRAGYALATLFPDARFLHVTRSPGEVVASLTGTPAEGGAFYTADAASRAWIAGAKDSLLLEEALGSGRVARVRYRDLVEDPHDCVDACLRFLGEHFEPGCLRPLAVLAADGNPEPAGTTQGDQVNAFEVPRASQEEIRQLLSRLAEKPSARPDAGAAARLARRFRRLTTSAHEESSLVERVQSLVGQAVPEGAVVAVVSRGDPRLIDLDGRKGWHLPQVRGGEYAGFHPADSREAVEHLKDLRRAGAEYLVVPATTLWWLTFYEGLATYLLRNCSLVCFHNEVGAVYKLASNAPLSPDGKPGPPPFFALPPTVFNAQEVSP